MTIVTEASSTIRPAKPVYKETPYESPAKLGNGVSAPSPAPTSDIPKFLPTAGDKVAPVKPASLVEAMSKIHMAAMQQIAYHERELKQLREMAASFASMSRQSDAPVQPLSAED